MATDFPRNFGPLTSPVPLSYLDDNFGQLQSASTSTVSLAGAALIGFMQSGSGAISRTAQAKMRDLVSVTDFGATGDGTTDDTADIQAAIDSLSTGCVVFPNGNYVVTALTMKSNVWLQMLPGSKLTVKASSAAAAKVLYFNAVTKCGILGNLYVDGNRANQTNTGGNGQFPVYITGACEDIYIQSGFVTGSAGDGLYIGLAGTAPKNIVIDRWVSDQAYRNGVSITNAENVTFGYLETRSTNGAAPEIGIDIETNSTSDTLKNIYIKRLVTHDNDADGFQILGQMDSATIVHGGVTIDEVISYSNGAAGGLIASIKDVVIKSGEIYSNTEAGLEIPRNVVRFKCNAHIHTNGLRGINAAMSSQALASTDWNLDGCILRNNSQTTGNSQDGALFTSNDAAKLLARVKARDIRCYDDQAVKTQRYGFNANTNTDSFEVTGYFPTNATGKYIDGGTRNFFETDKIGYSVAVDAGSVTAALTLDVTVALPTGSATSGDRIIAIPASGIEAGLLWSVWISGTDQATIRFFNGTASNIDPASRTWKFVISRI